ncbi:serine/threonine-protein kinase [Aestuariimicrobium sp. T2.26MG-19.2B]|uniref:serine/threonine-protein kinase n=1 Tax=Aestuariimicrobium sp. T2.26MG-19.2B TaxID=3040679 RepID=UPI0025416F67|nr:serine/threonine protein kinase [Aestuariimicrobium sp. T2.26MG-19.2B]
MGEVFGGRYELVDPLASGGSGVVWRVWDLRESTFRAAKVLKQSDSASLLRFMRETGWRISHPHVVTPLGWVGEDDRMMFTMPLVRGGSVSGLLKRRGPLPPGFAAAVTDQLLDALEKVHAQGLVHRDVKPANLLLNPVSAHQTPEAMLTDFGIAAPVGEPRMTRVTDVIGTPGYMSPEAAVGVDPEPKQDLYSVGVVLLEMLTGQRPPQTGKPVVPTAAERVPLGRFIARLLADEDTRIATATEARTALAEIDLPTQRQGVEVPDLIPALPEGWTDQGPLPSRPAHAPTQVRSEGFTPTQMRDSQRASRPAPAHPMSGQSAPGQFGTGQFGAGQFGAGQFAAGPGYQTGPQSAPQPRSEMGASGPVTGQFGPSQSATGQFATGQFGQFGQGPIAPGPLQTGQFAQAPLSANQFQSGPPTTQFPTTTQAPTTQFPAANLPATPMMTAPAGESVADWFRSLTPVAWALLAATVVVFIIVMVLLIG